MQHGPRLARSMARTSRVVASLMRRPHAYVTARHVLWTGFADTAEEMTDLIVRQRVRQPLLPWRGDLFFPEQSPGPTERMAVEETQAVLTGFEGAACHPSLAQTEQVASHLFLTQLIG